MAVDIYPGGWCIMGGGCNTDTTDSIHPINPFSCVNMPPNDPLHSEGWIPRDLSLTGVSERMGIPSTCGLDTDSIGTTFLRFMAILIWGVRSATDNIIRLRDP